MAPIHTMYCLLHHSLLGNQATDMCQYAYSLAGWAANCDMRAVTITER